MLFLKPAIQTLLDFFGFLSILVLLRSMTQVVLRTQQVINRKITLSSLTVAGFFQASVLQQFKSVAEQHSFFFKIIYQVHIQAILFCHTHFHICTVFRTLPSFKFI